jgi:sugar lactone lactonase YvrE
MLVSTKPGTISTIAGNGEPAHAGDDGPAVAASVNEPKNIAVDRADHLFIADSENHVIRRVDLKTGVIVTIAGRPMEPIIREMSGGVQDDPLPMDEDDPLGGPTQEVTSRFTQSRDVSGTVRFVTGTQVGAKRFSGDGGSAVEAQLNFPGAVAIDEQGHVYIADTMNHRIRKVDANSGLITTIAGTGQKRWSGDGGPAVSAALNEPTALALDQKGRLYIADQSNHRVRRLDLDTGIITTVAGTGEAGYSGDGMPAHEATLSGPSGLAIGADGTLYIADTFNGRIRKVDVETSVMTTVAGDGSEYRYQGNPHEFSTSLSRPYGIAIEADGHLLVTDSDSHLIRRWHRQKKIITRVAGSGSAGYSGDGGLPLESCLNYPFGLAVDHQGNIYIADTFNHRIRMIVAMQNSKSKMQN